MSVNHISLPDVGAALAGLSALSTAAFGLLDATKVFGGGPSNLGVGPIRAALKPFEPALANALGEADWWPVVRANWIAGVPKAEQKAKAQAIIKLGLSSANAKQIAAASHVAAAALEKAVKKLETGGGGTRMPHRQVTLDDDDMNVLGRMNATIDMLLDAAFEKADQAYRNWCRVLAGVIAVALALVVQANWPTGPDFGTPPTLLAALIVGVLAVPLAPLAKDLTSGLSAAMQALKASSKV